MSSLMDPRDARLHRSTTTRLCRLPRPTAGARRGPGVVTMGVAAARRARGVRRRLGSATAPDKASRRPRTASLAKVADIPVGGALSAKDADGKQILLTQPTAGTIVALSAICTHQGCTVAPDGDQLDCPCHGSVYDLTGGNVSGPAPEAAAGGRRARRNGDVFAGKA